MVEYVLSAADVFGSASSRKKIAQVVLLGAGMDTRIFRLRCAVLRFGCVS
jgi:O-methyltransferase involved in polyketide biosynthesis